MSNTTTPAKIPAIAKRINEHHRKAETALHSALEHARDAGRLLVEAKQDCPHGTWERWLAEHFDEVICADSCRARRVELMDAGDVVDVGKRRPTHSGRPAIVWIAREYVPKSDRPTEPSLEAPAGDVAEETHGTLAAGDQGERCPRCECPRFVETPIHLGRSVRLDCELCGAFVRFKVWHGKPVEPPRRGSAMDRLGRGPARGAARK